jgi:hypothetical protein
MSRRRSGNECPRTNESAQKDSFVNSSAAWCDALVSSVEELFTAVAEAVISILISPVLALDYWIKQLIKRPLPYSADAKRISVTCFVHL